MVIRWKDIERHLYASMLAERGGARYVVCDICSQSALLELHHIASKGRTQGNDTARLLSECMELTNLLCGRCHRLAPMNAHTVPGRNLCLCANIKRFGFEQVYAKWHEINEICELGFTLPEQSNGNHKK